MQTFLEEMILEALRGCCKGTHSYVGLVRNLSLYSYPYALTFTQNPLITL